MAVTQGALSRSIVAVVGGDDVQRRYLFSALVWGGRRRRWRGLSVRVFSNVQRKGSANSYWGPRYGRVGGHGGDEYGGFVMVGGVRAAF